MQRLQSIAVIAALNIAIALGACGSDKRAPIIRESISRAKLAVDVAKSSDTRRHAAAELALAEDKIVASGRAVERKEYEEADRLLAEAVINLELARAKSSAAEAKARLEERRSRAEMPPPGTPDASAERAPDGGPGQIRPLPETQP